MTDFLMPTMSGIELLRAQALRGCKLTIKNKAILSEHAIGEFKAGEVYNLGCAYFLKPFDLNEISTWLSIRELQMDLLRPLSLMQIEKRYAVASL